MEKDLTHLHEKRIELVSMGVDPHTGLPDPHPIESGTKGTVWGSGGGVIQVQWDNGRTLGLVDGVDTYKVIEDESYFDRQQKIKEQLEMDNKSTDELDTHKNY